MHITGVACKWVTHPLGKSGRGGDQGDGTAQWVSEQHTCKGCQEVGGGQGGDGSGHRWCHQCSW